MKDETIINVFSDIANFNLSIFGISITVFTVLYAFLLSKKDYIRELNELIKQEKAPLYAVRRVSFALVHMRRWRSLNTHLAIIAFSSLFFYVINIIAKYVHHSLTFAILDISATFLLASYLVLMLITAFKNYSRETNID